MERILDALSMEQNIVNPVNDSDFQAWCLNGCDKAESIIQGLGNRTKVFVRE